MNLFDLIARPYALFFRYQKRGFNQSIPAFLASFPEPIESILDVGCGTGAMCEVFQQNGLIVEGCDQSETMLKQARRLTSKKIRYTRVDATKGLDYPEKSFDVVIASFVAHGMQEKQRKELYAQMKRVARKAVVLHDYGQKRHWVSDFLEWLENGDYFRFIKVVDEELIETFGNLSKINEHGSAVWYKMEVK